MCGIAGIYSIDHQKVTEASLKKLTDAVAHRGPDGEGFWVHPKNHVGFGHRRLSILDLSENGKQPMPYAGGRYWITYNGEVFNFIELKQQLESMGYGFHSDTDTEVVLASYAAWGKGCLQRFNGMWALAIWDEQKQELFLARDRFGIKPLHYLYQPGKRFVFASETNQFKFLENYDRQLDEKNLDLALNDPDNLEGYGRTIYKDVHQVLPGHYMVLSFDKGLEPHRWWNTLDHIPVVSGQYAEQIEHFRELFIDACRIRLRSDVSIASALSGGLDSSSVYCMLYHCMNHAEHPRRVPEVWQRAYVAMFPGTAQDETVFAEKVIQHTSGEAVYLTPKYDRLAERIVDSVLAFDGICGSPLFVVSDMYQAMRRDGVTISMDGHGADEMLYGYTSSVKKAYQLAVSLEEYAYAEEIKEISLLMQHPSSFRYGLTNFYDRNQARVLTRVGNLLKKLLRPNLFFKKRRFLNDHDSSAGFLPGDQMDMLNMAERNLYEEFHLTFLPTILRDFDRASMRNSVEVRMPFMDHRLVSFVFGLPIESKLGGGYTKRILRDAMKGWIPEKIRTRTLKIGFCAPMTEWFSGVLSEFIADEINSSAFLKSPFWEGSAIRDLALNRIKQKNWTRKECFSFWVVFNAHLLISKQKNNNYFEKNKVYVHAS